MHELKSNCVVFYGGKQALGFHFAKLGELRGEKLGLGCLVALFEPPSKKYDEEEQPEEEDDDADHAKRDEVPGKAHAKSPSVCSRKQLLALMEGGFKPFRGEIDCGKWVGVESF